MEEGSQDRLTGGEGEDTYMVKDGKQSSVFNENDSRDSKTDLATTEANVPSFKVRVEDDNVHVRVLLDSRDCDFNELIWSSAHRHLLFVTKDLITFTVSENKTDSLQNNVFTRCIKSHSIDYSSSPSALVVDFQEDDALDSMTEVRRSKFDDVVKGNEPNRPKTSSTERKVSPETFN